VISLKEKVKLSILSFGYTNVREFESLTIPEANQEFRTEGINLLQIQNGYGKTTTLYLLRSLFTGIPIRSAHMEGYKYRRDGKWGGDSSEIVRFQTKFRIKTKKGAEDFTLGLEIDPNENEQSFWTYRSKLGGREEGWKPPPEFVRLFEGKNRFAQLFLLDGETARELNKYAGADLVHDSIRQITGTNILHTLVGDNGVIETVLEKATAEALGSRGGKERSLDATFQAAVIRKRELNEKANSYKERLEGLEARQGELKLSLDRNEEELEDLTSGLALKKDGWLTKRRILKEKTESVLKSLFDPSISMGSNWAEVVSFHGSQQRGKLPKAVGRTFFRELQEADSCICGAQWTPGMKTHVNLMAEGYLEDRLMTYVKEVQDAVSRSDGGAETIGTLMAKLRVARTEMQESKTAYELKKSQLPEGEREKLRKMSEELGGIEKTIEGVKILLEDIISTSDEYIAKRKLDQHTWTGQKISTSASKVKKIGNMKELQKVLDNLQKQFDETGEAMIKKAGAEALRQILETTLEGLGREIKIEVESKLNGHLSNMVGAGLGGGLTVEISDQGLRYKNPNGEYQDAVNVASELGGAYAFVSALNSYAEVSLPFVLDTPLAGFGKGMVSSWATLVPNTFDQCIALINSLEREGLDPYHGGNEYSNWTIRREREEIKLGAPQEGRMICDPSYENFCVYEEESHERQGGGKI
jgi:DNA sulfur modification protein DndD